MEKKKRRHFVLMENGKDTEHVFTGRFPRVAALKAAVFLGYESPKDILLREVGTKRVHVFKGSVQWVTPKHPESVPKWIQLSKEGKVKQGVVEKVEVKHLFLK